MKAKVFAFLLATLLVIVGASAVLAADTGLRSQCAKMCQKTLNYLKKTGGKHAEPDRLKTVQNCIDSCNNNAKAHKAKAANASQIDESCAVVCKSCAEKCEELKDPKLKDCVAMCNKCASACETHDAAAAH